MLKSFINHIKTHIPSLFGSKILIATSSGLDSVVLTDLCQKLNLNVALAHCNFQLRGAESDNEEAFILDYAKQHKLQIFTKKFNTQKFANSTKQSIQMAARQLRYEWFENLAQNNGFDYILTAHHADDNLETFFINLIRGTGIEGLTGISEQHASVIRPLLPFNRDQILNYAKDNNLEWCEDSSNSSMNYIRNRLRHKLIPILKSICPEILDRLVTTQSYLTSSKEVLKSHIDTIENKVCSFNEVGEIYYNIEAIKSYGDPTHYLYLLLSKYGFTDWEALKKLLIAQSGKQILSSTHKIIKHRHVLIVSPITESEPFEMAIFQDQAEIFVSSLSKFLKIMKSTQIDPIERNTIFVDSSKLKFPLTLRSWRPGDYFYPYGMDGKKKVSKFFKDEKLAITEKSRTLILCSNGQIVWILGMRPDNRFVANSDSTSILKISFENAIN